MLTVGGVVIRCNADGHERHVRRQGSRGPDAEALQVAHALWHPSNRAQRPQIAAFASVPLLQCVRYHDSVTVSQISATPLAGV